MLFLSLQALIKPSKNKRLRNVIALCALLTPIYALANDHFSSWSDKTICRLAKATPDNVEYQAESTKRGLSCGGAIKSSQSDYDPAPNINSELFDGWVLADEAKEMFDNHVKQSALLKVPLPSSNSVIKNYERYKDYRKNILAKNYHFTNYLWKEKVDGTALTQEACMKILTEFKVPSTPTIEEQKFKRCDANFETYAVMDFEGGIKLYEELILAIASARPDNWSYKNSGTDDFNPRDYNVWGVLSTYLMFYAVNYDQFDYSTDERQIINNYFKSKAMIERQDRDGNRSRTSLCPIKDPMKLTARYNKVNNCGSVRFRFAPAELALAVVMQDEDLWAKGLWDLDYTLSMIEKEGFFVPLSAKGCKALGYTWDTSKLLSLNVEMLKLADFNLLDYKTRHGKTISEAYETLFKQYEDITISNHIAKKGVGAASCGTKPYKTHEEFLYYEFGGGVDPDKLLEAYDQEHMPTQEDFVNWSIRFVAEKHPEWLNDTHTLNQVKIHEWLGAYFKVQAFEIYNANVVSESGNIWEKKNRIWEEKQRQIEIIRIEKIEEQKAKSRVRLKKNALKIKAQRIEDASKLSIFEFDGGTFNLALAKGDFIETGPFELERSTEYLWPWQLHKGFINGKLKTKSNGSKWFNNILVYKHNSTQEQKLVINVDTPRAKPLARHKDSLEKKCGLKSMEWGWLTFISQTNDIKSAKNQQCHYDYFKEANDKPAWELFQTVLGGTDSILGYLQTNVER